MQNVFLEKSGMRAKILSRGASLASLYLDGHKDSLVLELADFASDDQHFGAIAGPVAGRIRGGSCVIAGARHEFERNENGRTTLHGGSGGLGRQIWQIEAQAEDFVELVLEQPDGKLDFRAIGALPAVTSWRRAAFCGWSWALSAMLKASAIWPFTPISVWMTGLILPITACRFWQTAICLLMQIICRPGGAAGCRNRAGFPPGQIACRYCRRTDGCGGYSFCLAEKQRPCQPVARLTSARSGIAMEISTDQPGLQFYTGTHIPAGLRSANGRQLGPFAGLCLEPQAWPDAPNQPHFPSIRLAPDQPYHQLSELRFSCR